MEKKNDIITGKKLTPKLKAAGAVTCGLCLGCVSCGACMPAIVLATTIISMTSVTDGGWW